MYNAWSALVRRTFQPFRVKDNFKNAVKWRCWNIILDIYFIYLFIIGTAIRGASVKVKHYIKYLFYLLSVRRLEGPLLKWNIILNIYFIYLFIIGMAIRGASVIGVLYWWVFVPQERAPTTCLFYFYFF